ncbi:MAG TPA: hypothetical protein VLB73_04980 [Patescibacteria group bacterium]|nr:hypothetical protein [Patescibacteria group bacterium]
MKLSLFLKLLSVGGLLTALFLSPQKIFAARSITISSSQTVLHGYDEMTVTISSMSGFTSGETIYIKGALYKDGSTNYFGYTKNNDNWIKNSDATTNQRQVQIGSWDQSLIVKSDFDDSGYVGEGEYKLKIGFYYTTSGGNLAAVTWSSNSLDVEISDPDPTPTPTPTPTNTPTPTLKPTPTPTAKLSPTSTPTARITVPVSLELSSDSAILGASISAIPTLVKAESDKKVSSVNFLAIFLIIGGIFILSSCGILFYYHWKKGKENNEESNE